MFLDSISFNMVLFLFYRFYFFCFYFLLVLVLFGFILFSNRESHDYSTWDDITDLEDSKGLV